MAGYVTQAHGVVWQVIDRTKTVTMKSRVIVWTGGPLVEAIQHHRHVSLDRYQVIQRKADRCSWVHRSVLTTDGTDIMLDF